MRISINDKDFFFEKPITIAEVISTIKCNTTQVAIEHNKVIIPRSQYSNTIVKDGDIIECVEFIGGG